MKFLDELETERKSILAEITDSASKGLTEQVLAGTAKLQGIEQLISRQKEINADLERLRGFSDGQILKAWQPERIRSSESRDKSKSDRSSSRILGRRLRKELLKKLSEKGINLQLVKGQTIFRTGSGKRVGIAVATERQTDRWFLGLPEGAFDHAILLCKPNNAEVIEVPLPERFFIDYGKNLSVSKGQIKFNVARRVGRVLLQVPRTNGISVESYANNFDFLR